MNTSSFELFGIRLDALSNRGLVDIVSRELENPGLSIIGNHNLHSLYLWFHDLRVQEFYRLNKYTHIDGMSLVLLGRLFGLPLKREHRATYVDLLPLLAAEAARRQWRIFYLGSRPGVGEKAARILREHYVGLQIATHHGYFDAATASSENLAVLAEINDYAPDILMVGMGMPRQEVWLLENHKEIGARAVLCCGAMMDYTAGEIPSPPRWIGRLGFEWLYRLLSEPARLWGRYLVEPWSVMRNLAGLYLSSAHLNSRDRVGSNE